MPQELSLAYINQMQQSEEFIRDMEAYETEFPSEPLFEDEPEQNAAGVA